MADLCDKSSKMEGEQLADQPTCSHIEISQNRLDALTCQLDLSVQERILLERHLNAANILAPDVKRASFIKYFDRNEANTLAFCNSICGLMQELGHEYQANEWRLFIDESKRSLKAILMYKDNTKIPVPLAISANANSNSEAMKTILEKINYNENFWTICADLKVICILRDLHSGNTKNMCYICQWNFEYIGDQYMKRDWPSRRYTRACTDNAMNEPFVPMEKVLLSPLFIKLGLVKHFIKALVERENDRAVNRLNRVSSRLMMKIKEGKTRMF